MVQFSYTAQDGPQKITQGHLEAQTVLTMFDYIDFDEDRDPVAAKSWLG